MLILTMLVINGNKDQVPDTLFTWTCPSNWKSKKQATIETSVYGAELIAMEQGMEAMQQLDSKLRMMGVFLPRPSYYYGDNMFVIHNI